MIGRATITASTAVLTAATPTSSGCNATEFAHLTEIASVTDQLTETAFFLRDHGRRKSL